MNLFYHFFFWISYFYRWFERTRFVKKERISGKVHVKHFYTAMVVAYFGFALINYFDFLLSGRVLTLSVFLPGLFLYLLAWGLRQVAMKTLNKMFSPDIEIRDKHELIQKGPYQYVRHPLLLALALETLANALMAGSVLGIFLTLTIYWPLIVVRKILEEKELVSHFGEAYRNYQKNIGAFLPVQILWKH